MFENSASTYFSDFFRRFSILIFSLSAQTTFNIYEVFDEEKCQNELGNLWSSLEDIFHPTLEDYKKIDQHLRLERNYLHFPFDPKQESRLNVIMGFQLLGSKEEMPLFEKYSFNVTEDTKNRCILLYASQNGIYPEKARHLLFELKEKKFSGHVLLQIGGFPNTENGGLKFCHIPYAFKACFLLHAKLLGYKEVLWLDLSIHPLSNFEMFFSEIQKRGYFFTMVGSLQENARGHTQSAALSLGISPGHYSEIPHISSAILGFDLNNPTGEQLLMDWLKEMERVSPCITWFPEELSLSVIAWRRKCQPFYFFENIVCKESERYYLPRHLKTIEAFIDSRR